MALPYVPTVWQSGDLVSSTRLNKLEGGVKENSDAIVTNTSDIGQLKSQITDIEMLTPVVSRNRWNPDESVADKSIIASGANKGNLTNQPGYTVSGFIGAEQNDTVRWDYNNNAVTAGQLMNKVDTILQVAEYDENKECLTVSANWVGIPYTVQNADTKYVRLAVATKGTNSVLINGASTGQIYYFPYEDEKVGSRMLSSFPLGDNSFPIKEIYFTAFSRRDLRIVNIGRAQGGNYYVVAFDGLDNRILLLNKSTTGFDETAPITFNVSGYKGRMIVDWDAIQSGGIYNANYPISQAAYAMGDLPSKEIYPYAETSDAPIFNIVFTEYDPTKKYYIDGIGRKVNSTPVHYVRLKDNSNNSYLILNVLSSSYTEVAKNDFSVTGLAGTFWIDWSKMEEGSQKGFGNPYFSEEVFANSDIYKAATGSNIIAVAPSTIYGVVGHPISLYYYNIFKKDTIDDVHFRLGSGASANAENMGNRLRLSCASAGTTAFSISMRKDGNANLITKNISVEVVAENIPSIKALFIGDSFVDGGKMQAELKHLMGENLTFYGTRSSNTTDSTGATQTILDEGRSSWSLNDYLTLASKGLVTNAFWDGSKFDFSYYMTQNPTFADVTDVFIMSGPNDFGYSAAQFIQKYQTIVNSIKAFSESIRIHILMPLTVNCTGYAWGTRNYNNQMEYRYAMLDFGQAIIDTFTSDSQCFVVPTHVYFDKDYNFPTTTVAVNDRTPTTVTVFNDNVHPNEYGYFSMADIVFGDIVKNCQ